MQLSQHFGRTLRDAPAEATLTAQRLLLRAGLVRSLENGRWAYLPMGWRVMRNLGKAVRQVMTLLDAEECHFPLHPKQSSAEQIAALCSNEIESYKELPRLLTYFGDQVNAIAPEGSGFLRQRVYHAQESTSLHTDADDLKAFYLKVLQAYERVFEQCGVDAVRCEAADDPDLGASHVFLSRHPAGDESLTICTGCGIAATLSAARFERGPAQSGDPLPLEKVATPDCKTIADLCDYLDITSEQTLKAVFYTLDPHTPKEKTVLVMLRGDLDVSEEKVLRLLDATQLRAATEDEIHDYTGAAPGYASPVGLTVRKQGEKEGVIVIGDLSLDGLVNSVTGANEEGYHFINANLERDFSLTLKADIAQAYAGADCPHCGGELQVERAFRLGHSSKKAVGEGAMYLDNQGKSQPILMGQYHLWLDQLLAATVEANHDDYGVIWPKEFAPYDLHLVALVKDEVAAKTAEALYADLKAQDILVLYDDRGLSPGVMFADADLFGIPLRITVSGRSIEKGGVEAKWRHDKDRGILPLERVVDQIRVMLEADHLPMT